MAFSTWVTVFAVDHQFSFFSVLYSTSPAPVVTVPVTRFKMFKTVVRNNWETKIAWSLHPFSGTLASLSLFVLICDAVTKKRTGIIIFKAFLALPFLKLNFRKRVNLSSNPWLEAPMENFERFMNVHVGVCACFFAGLNDLVLEPLRKLFFSSQVYVKVSQYLFFFSFGKMLTWSNNLCTFYRLISTEANWVLSFHFLQ